MSKRDRPWAQNHLTLLTLDLWLTDNSTLRFAHQECVIEPYAPRRISSTLKAVLNSAYAYRGYGPPFEHVTRQHERSAAYFGVTAYDDRASSCDRYKEIEFLLSRDGRNVTGFNAVSQPGEIYLYVYDQDLGEITREIVHRVLPLLERDSLSAG